MKLLVSRWSFFIIAFMIGSLSSQVFANGSQDEGGNVKLRQESLSETMDLSKYEKADIDWRQFEGERILIAMNQHWFTDAMEQVLEEFEALTGINTVLDVYPEEEFRKKRLIAMASDSGFFDVMMMDQSLSQYAEAGWLEPLTPYIEDPELTDRDWYDLDDIFKKSRNFGTHKGKFYGLPITGEAEIVFYRKDLFEKAGLKFPETMDGLLDAAKRLKTDSVAGIVNRGQRGAGANVWPWSGFLFTYGGRFFNDEGFPIFNNREAVAATEMYVKLLQEAGPKGVTNYNWYECANDFQQGKAAMFIDSSGFMPMFTDSEKSAVHDKVGYALLPGVPGKEVLPNFWYWMIAMASNSEHKGASWLFLEWVTSKQTALKIALIGGSSSRESVWAHKDFQEKYPADWAAITSETLSIADPTLVPYSKKEFPEFGEIISIAIQDAINGTVDVKEGLDNAVDETRKILGK